MMNYKFNIVGDYGVGKTTFMHSLLPEEKRVNLPDDELTLDFVFYDESDEVKGKFRIKFITSFEVVDGCDAYITICDLTDEESFEYIEDIFKNLVQDKKRVMLIGNKDDMYEKYDPEDKEWVSKLWKRYEHLSSIRPRRKTNSYIVLHLLQQFVDEEIIFYNNYCRVRVVMAEDIVQRRYISHKI